MVDACVGVLLLDKVLEDPVIWSTRVLGLRNRDAIALYLSQHHFEMVYLFICVTFLSHFLPLAE